ncbi:DNA cytosine methyltransferase [Streptococcus sanguinis]|uniref:DNA cytosine methyltransferase n=1 Tax=Streptococcus sanguinis TaxID=1305 RepID=UPI001D15317B|nr:DNA cytosine methyltransferase [Streptococcus sanguinis]MCC3172522.1 DNA (cytosine-5-)-methyltransferase family protein [Streptococcus sanguinis]
MKSKKNKKRLTVIDFFCGAGGFSEGFRRAGYDVIMGIDVWQPAIITHNFNHGLNDNVKSVLDFEDIEEINKLPDTDIIIGSPPCQLFSLSNQGGNANKDLGIHLINTFFKVIAVKKFQKNSKLKAWLMENVPNSQNYVQEEYTFEDLDLASWAVSQGLNPKSIAIKSKYNGGVLHADDYGAAQARRRFVSGEITKTGEFPFPDRVAKEKVTLNKLFRNFPDPLDQSPVEFVTDPNYPNESVKFEDFKDHFYDTGVYQVQWQKARDLKQRHPYMGKMSFPENMDKPSRTIMATQSASTREAILYKSGYNRKGDGEYRLPTIREAACIMGYPLDYQFFGDESTKWRQIGNAVCVQLSFALAIKILELIKEPQLPAKTIDKDINQFKYLDNKEIKEFNNPPTRNEKALFRQFPIKSGNMTVDLTNKINGEIGNWGVIAHAGTGKGFKSIIVSRSNQMEAKKILRKLTPDLIKELENDKVIKKYSVNHLNQENKRYGFFKNDISHPYYIINYIGGVIDKYVDSNDVNVDVSGTELFGLKELIPLSQIMSLYMVSIIIYGK